MNRPQWSWREPAAKQIQQFLEAQRGAAWSYAEVGASRSDAERPGGYDLDHNRIQLGHGARVYAAACTAIQQWRMFPSAWTRISPPAAPIRVGQTVAMIASALGLWWINAARIVYTIDGQGPIRRFGFAYGTLLAHVEEGEERFSVEQHEDGTVWYDLRAFSRPRYWPVRIGKPITRRLQARFVRDSQASMRAAVASVAPKAPMASTPVFRG